MRSVASWPLVGQCDRLPHGPWWASVIGCYRAFGGPIWPVVSFKRSKQRSKVCDNDHMI